MANTVITSTTNSIKVVFNDDSAFVGIDKGTWLKTAITNFKLYSDHVEAETHDGLGRWIMTHDGAVGLSVDSIDGVAVISNSDLYDKLSAMVA